MPTFEKSLLDVREVKSGLVVPDSPLDDQDLARKAHSVELARLSGFDLDFVEGNYETVAQSFGYEGAPVADYSQTDKAQTIALQSTKNSFAAAAGDMEAKKRRNQDLLDSTKDIPLLGTTFRVFNKLDQLGRQGISSAVSSTATITKGVASQIELAGSSARDYAGMAPVESFPESQKAELNRLSKMYSDLTGQRQFADLPGLLGSDPFGGFGNYERNGPARELKDLPREKFEAAMTVIGRIRKIMTAEGPDAKAQYAQTNEFAQFRKSADALVKQVEEDLQIDPELAQEMLGKLASGAGSTIPYIASALVNPAIAMAAAESALFEEAIDEYRKADPNAAPADLLRFGLSVGVPGAALEMLGAPVRFASALAGAKAGVRRKIISEMAKSFVGEGFTEAAQGGILDFMASTEFDSEREVITGEGFERRLDEFLIGGFVGGLLGGAGAGISILSNPKMQYLDKQSFSPESFKALSNNVTEEEFAKAFESETLQDIARAAWNGSQGAQNALRVLAETEQANVAAEDSQAVTEADKEALKSKRKEVALTKAEIAEVRKDFDLDQLPTIERKSFEAILQTAKENKTDQKAEAIADELIRNPRVVTEDEHAGMVLRATQLEREYESKIDLASQASRDGNPDLAASLSNQAALIQEKLDTIERAANISGSEASRALNIRKMRIRKDDYSLSRMVNLAEANKGSALTPVEQDFFKRLSDKIKKQREQIDKLQKQVDDIKDGKIPSELKKRLTRTLVEHQQARREGRKKIDEFRKKSFIERAGDIAALPRALLATADMSAVLRQGALLSARRPIKATKALADSTKAMFSQYKADEIDLALRSRPTFEFGNAAGLYLTPLDRIDLVAREETFASSLAERIPGWGKVVLASERHMVTHLNILRAAAFDQFVADQRKMQIPKDQMMRNLKAWATYVNNASGRGTLGGFESSAKALSTLMFSPRFAVSRFQAPMRLATNWSNKTVRNEIAKDFAWYAGIGTTALTLAWLAGAEVSDDPEESDFGKIKIGDTRVDIWGGFQQPMRLMMLWGTSGASRTGLIDQPDVDLRDATMRFAMYKASPQVSIVSELFTGENVLGEETTVIETVVRNSLPLIMQEGWEAFNSDEPENALFVVPASFVGLGTSTYDKSSSSGSRSRPTRTRQNRTRERRER